MATRRDMTTVARRSTLGQEVVQGQSTLSSGRRHLALSGAIVAGACLVAGSAAIHLHLWLAGYRHIHIIGQLFLAQAISGFVISAAMVLNRRLPSAVTGALFLAATAAGLLMSAWFGIFGFHDSLDAPYAGLSLIEEGAGTVLLVSAAGAWGLHTRGARRRLPTDPRSSRPVGETMRPGGVRATKQSAGFLNRWWAG
jgi:hypothetical protein